MMGLVATITAMSSQPPSNAGVGPNTVAAASYAEPARNKELLGNFAAALIRIVTEKSYLTVGWISIIATRFHKPASLIRAPALQSVAHVGSMVCVMQAHALANTNNVSTVVARSLHLANTMENAEPIRWFYPKKAMK